MTRSILIVDADESIAFVLGRFFERKGWAVWTATGSAAALAVFERENPDLIILDLALPGAGGTQLLEVLRARDPDAALLGLTGHTDGGAGVAALRAGAETFLTKPLEMDHLEAAAERALETVELRRHNRFFTERQTLAGMPDPFAAAPALRDVFRQVELLAPGDAAVLILGETGTGKGWVARRLHARSPRAAAPFVELHCIGLDGPLLEAELFGHANDAGARDRATLYDKLDRLGLRTSARPAAAGQPPRPPK